jgi:hypothetical protein
VISRHLVQINSARFVFEGCKCVAAASGLTYKRT